MGIPLSNPAKRIFNHCSEFVQSLVHRECMLCTGPSDGTPWCAACDADFPRLPETNCPICALPLPVQGICGACLAEAPLFDAAVAAFTYSFPADKLVAALKFGSRLSLALPFGAAISQSVRQRPDLIVPMPLSPERLRERGFNQAQEIARHVSGRIGVPIATDACHRVLHTSPQSQLPWKERSRNVRRAFVCVQDLTGLHVAVVDDVMTTGSTMNEVARTLKKAGASRVTAWVVCRTLKPGDHPPGPWPVRPRGSPATRSVELP